MDDSLKALEERLEQLVPKGLSDLGRERMEDQIDALAESLQPAGQPAGLKWAVGGAAAALAMALVFWSPDPSGGEAVAENTLVEAPVAESVSTALTEADLFEMLTLSSIREVETRTDRGWVADGEGDLPHRYWSYRVTDKEELIDEESGYSVSVVSQHEQWVPVAVTSL
jgi:hypothetical protein